VKDRYADEPRTVSSTTQKISVMRIWFLNEEVIITCLIEGYVKRTLIEYEPNGKRRSIYFLDPGVSTKTATDSPSTFYDSIILPFDFPG